MKGEKWEEKGKVERRKQEKGREILWREMSLTSKFLTSGRV